MTDDAAQDKKTEDDSIAEADAQGSAETEKIDAVEHETVKIDTAKAEKLTEEAEKPAPATESAATGKSALMAGVAVPMVALIALGVLLVAAVAAAAGFFWQSHTRANELDERTAPTEAACGFMRVFAAYDEKSMPDFAEQVKARITDGKFKKSFEPAATGLQELLIKQHAKATLNFLHCAYETGDADKATVLVNALQTASNDLHSQPLVLPIPAFVELREEGREVAGVRLPRGLRR